jgi:hypothetical protein
VIRADNQSAKVRESQPVGPVGKDAATVGPGLTLPMLELNSIAGNTNNPQFFNNRHSC